MIKMLRECLTGGPCQPGLMALWALLAAPGIVTVALYVIGRNSARTLTRSAAGMVVAIPGVVSLVFFLYPISYENSLDTLTFVVLVAVLNIGLTAIQLF